MAPGVTRFIPAPSPGDGAGMWARYYERWANMTLERGGAVMMELVPELQRFAPPSLTIDKRVCSPWLGSDLRSHLRAGEASTAGIRRDEPDRLTLA